MEKVRPRRGGGQASRRAVTRCAATAQPPVTVESVAHLGPPSPLTLKDIARAGAHLWRSAEDLGHAPPRAVSTVHTAATALGERSEFFSARHPQFNDDLAAGELVAFPRENLFHAPAVTRCDVHFVGFDGARDGVWVPSGLAAGNHEGQNEGVAG